MLHRLKPLRSRYFPFVFTFIALIPMIMSGCSIKSNIIPESSYIDQEFFNLIIGKWLSHKEDSNSKGNKIIFDAITSYKSDGSFEVEAVVSMNEKKIMVNVKGSWKVQDGFIFTKVLESNNTKAVKINSTYKDKIIKISENNLVTLNEKDKIEKLKKLVE